MRLSILVVCLSCATAACAAAPGPRELVHPFPPTGPVEVAGAVQANRVMRAIQRYATPTFTDLLAMHVANTLQDADDAPAVVTRKHRQVGNVALSYVSAAAPDGRTLLFAPAAGAGRTVLRPVAIVATMPYVVVTTGDVPWKTLGELVRDAGPRDSRLLFASPGGLSAGHAALRSLRARMRIPVEPVSYNGGNAALQAVAQKQVVASLVPLPTVLPYLPAGRVKAIAIADTRRHPAISDIRTSAESGFDGFEAAGAFAVFAPSATPPGVVRDLDRKLARIGAGDARDLFEAFGLRLEHRSGFPSARE
ncbi:MAG TPA: tripartite tricarboxylate transporter substrate-binding protein [Burkholderiales bacterium]|nr:tripartite tricarboxylate transporter substrate-binding protein [Burkholderiales bacterium]